MNTCLNEDTLLRLGEALEWKVDEPLRHLHDCRECAAMLADLRDLHLTFARSEPPDPELISLIMGALEKERSAEGTAAGRVAPAVMDRGIRFFAAAVIAFVILTTGGAMQADQPVALAPVLLLAVLSGAIASAISERGSTVAGPTSPRTTGG